MQEPASDAWVQRTPGATEKPVNNQFYARDPIRAWARSITTAPRAGTPDSVYLEDLYDPMRAMCSTPTSPDARGGAYAFSVPIAAGKVTYKVVYGTTTGGDRYAARQPVTNLVCGDAYIIDGQSNALATDNTAPNDTTTDPWIRTYGASGRLGLCDQQGPEMQLGYWGMDPGQAMVTNYNMPVCIINGAVGGTRIDQHQAQSGEPCRGEAACIRSTPTSTTA